jgi:predicted metal-dependent peptidase
MDATEKLRVAKLKVLNGNQNMRLYGCLLYKFDISIIDNPGMTAFVTYDNGYKMCFDKTFIEEHTTRELVYVVIHEQCHILCNHISRGIHKSNRALFNIATDHVINDRLDKDTKANLLNNIEIPNDRTVINYFSDKNVTAEEVYDYLLKHAEVETETFQISMESPSASGSSSGSSSSSESNSNSEQSESESDPQPQNSGTVEVKKLKITMPDGQVIEHIEDVIINGKINQQKKAEEDTKGIQSEAKAIINSNLMSKGKGSSSSGILELIKEFVETPLPWDELVDHAIKNTVSVSSENKSWKSLNKRLQSHNMLLPGYGTEERVDTLVLVIDTSGSMSENDFKKFISIIRNSVQYFNKIIKIDHDYTITNYVELLESDVQMDTEEIYKFTGRGGTSHRDVFDRIEELVYENEEEISLVFFLTDYCSDIEQIWNNYKWPKDIPVKFILTDKHPKVSEHIDKTPIYI